MIRPSEWDTFPAHHRQHHQSPQPEVFKEPEITQSDILAQIKKKREQDRKRNAWESDFEKMKQEFMSSTPFKTRLGGDYFNSSFNGDNEFPSRGKSTPMPDSPSFSSSKERSFRKDTKDNLFRVEFDVNEFDPATVKVKLEDGTWMVIEAKQTSHRSTKEFFRKVHVPPRTNTDRLVCRLTVSGMLIAEIPEPPTYPEACKECKRKISEQSDPGRQEVSHISVQDTKPEIFDNTDSVDISGKGGKSNGEADWKEPSHQNSTNEFSPTSTSSHVIDVKPTAAPHTPILTEEDSPHTPTLTRIKRQNSVNGYDNVPTTPGGTKIIREYEMNGGETSGMHTFPRRTKIVREYSENIPAPTPKSAHVTRHSISLDSGDSATKHKKPEVPTITVSTPTTPRRTQIIREYEQNGDSAPPTQSAPRQADVTREHKTTVEDSSSSPRILIPKRFTEITNDYSSHTLPTRRRTTIVRDVSPVTRHSKVTSSSKPRHGESTTEHTGRAKVERTQSTPAKPRHTEIIREYASTPSSPRLTRLMRSTTEDHTGSMSPGTLHFSTMSPGIKPRSSEFTSRNSSRRYTPSTFEYVPTPSSKRYTLNHVRHASTPHRTEFGADIDGDTFAYSPITIKYSTLPTKGRQKTHKVLVGRSNSQAVEPQWRSSRHPKINLSDSVDSEATLSSSPSDDLYQGHSSFSDLDL